MSINKSFIITTTPTIEGTTIEKYLGPIASHVVAGTGLFSDMAAELSNIFGGRSESYQKQLKAINDEAIEIIRREAISKGANAIVGLTIDQDDISGGGKSMFMVKALGTAVKLKDNLNKVIINEEVPNSLDYITIDNKIEEIELKRLATKGIHGLNTKQLWEKALELELGEIIPDVIKTIEKIKKDNYSDYYNQAKTFLTSLDRELVFNYRSEIYHSSIDLDLFKELLYIHKLVDYNIVLDILNSDNYDLMRKAISSLSFHKYFYSKEDIELLVKISDMIPKVKNNLINRINIKAKLTGKITEKWVCVNGHKNLFEDEYCRECYCDKYGFNKKSDLNKIQKDVSQLLNALKDLYQNS